MMRWQRDLYAENSLERAMFDRRQRPAGSSNVLGAVLLFGLLVFAAIAHFAG